MKFKNFLFISLIILALLLPCLFIWQNYINIAYIQINVEPEASQIKLNNIIVYQNTKTKIRPGTYTLKVLKEGFLPKEETLIIKRKQFLQASYSLSKKATLSPIQSLNSFKGLKPLWLNSNALISIDPTNNSFVSYNLSANYFSSLSENFKEPISDFVVDNENGLIFFVSGYGDEQKYYYFWIFSKKIEEVNLTNFSGLSNFSFTPDGDLSFTAIEKNQTQFSELYTYEKNSSSFKSVSPGMFIQATKIRWINNYQVLVYKQEDAPNSGFLSLFDLKAKKLTTITEENNFTQVNFSLSPDKSRLLSQDQNGIKIISLNDLRSLKLNTKVPTKTLTIPLVWLDDNNILLMNEKYQIITFNLVNQKSEVLISDEPAFEQLIEYLPAPDGKKTLLLVYGGRYFLVNFTSLTNP